MPQPFSIVKPASVAAQISWVTELSPTGPKSKFDGSTRRQADWLAAASPLHCSCGTALKAEMSSLREAGGAAEGGERAAGRMAGEGRPGSGRSPGRLSTGGRIGPSGSQKAV